MQRRAWLLTLLLGAVGCAHTGLGPAIRHTLPSVYRERRPADSRPQLGSVADAKGTVKFNDCYEGEVEAPDPSWSSVVASYKNSASGDVKADFGDLVTVSGGGGGGVSGSITLDHTVIFHLKNLYFLPSSGCAQRPDWRAEYLSSSGRKDPVIVRAITADRIDVNLSTTSSSTWSANTTQLPNDIKVAANGATSAELTQMLSGTGLFYAQQISRVTTMLTEKEQVVRVGQGTDFLESCHVLISGKGPSTKFPSQEEWVGSLDCQGGETFPMSGVVGGTVAAEKVAEGVSYGVYVSEAPETGHVNVQISRWVVTQR